TTTLYRFPPGGGTLASATLAVQSDAFGLAFGPAGRLYATRLAGDVVELDPATGAILRTVATNPDVNILVGITFDPISRDMFVSTLGNSGPDDIFRISNYA